MTVGEGSAVNSPYARVYRKEVAELSPTVTGGVGRYFEKPKSFEGEGFNPPAGQSEARP